MDQAVIATGNRANDNIVCSLLGMLSAQPPQGHLPFMVEAETMRALVDVLGRAGYTRHGRAVAPETDWQVKRDGDKMMASHVRKAT